MKKVDSGLKGKVDQLVKSLKTRIAKEQDAEKRRKWKMIKDEFVNLYKML